ncbi:MAG: hypothetical protein J6Y85_05675 [Alphaproteobacteria bacterium]|nr:hypothetical protein [Alphaproteobacteria bacterium]
MKYIFLGIFFLVMGCQSMAWEALYGVSKTDVKARMGEPVSMMQENNNEIWTYRQGQCTKHVFFDGNGIVKYIDAKGVCSK